MSELREQLIQSGRLMTKETKEQVERIAKQLFNVAKHVENGQDSVPAEDTPWEPAESDIQEAVHAMARYVLSTYTENDRLRAKVKQLEEARDEWESRYESLLSDIGGVSP